MAPELNETLSSSLEQTRTALVNTSFPLALFVSVVAASWIVYRSIRPPPPNICGAPNGPPVTAPRVKLRDGRFLAYREAGVPKEEAKFKILTIHGYGGSRNSLLGGISDEIVKELGIYYVGFDRAGYGQSTPYPHRSLKSDAYDAQDLADALGLGSTFYVAATSMGGYTGYALVKYLPHRLAGIALIAPVVNFWWSGLPRAVVDNAYAQQAIGDRLALRVVHHAPWLVYWYFTQTWLPTSSTVKIEQFQMEENEKLRGTDHFVNPEELLEPVQQGRDESRFRDARVMFGKWDFEPFDLENPFAGRSGSAHIWQGGDDFLVPPVLQREVAKRIPWAQYHEIPGATHSLSSHPGLPDEIIRTLLPGKS